MRQRILQSIAERLFCDDLLSHASHRHLERKMGAADKGDASGTSVTSCDILPFQSIHYQGIRFGFAAVV